VDRKGKPMETRREMDPLGEKEVPKQAYYGIQTLRAVENFPVSGNKVPAVFIEAYVKVKKAAALTNMKVGCLEPRIGKVIVQGCDEVIAGKFQHEFVVDVFQAGAGTSFNMNMNEVLANRALELLGKEKGDYRTISPNDHVNMGQSTNDTYPTALHVAVLMAAQTLLKALDTLADAFEELSKKNLDVVKSGRTHLQDALPITVGQELGAYASAIRNARSQLDHNLKGLFRR
jgi:aspartate ammonia-lyase